MSDSVYDAWADKRRARAEMNSPVNQVRRRQADEAPGEWIDVGKMFGMVEQPGDVPGAYGFDQNGRPAYSQQPETPPNPGLMDFAANPMNPKVQGQSFSGYLGKTLSEVAGDMARPLVDNPAFRAIGGGVRDGVQGMFDLTADALEASGYNAESVRQLKDAVPEIPEGDSVAEGMARGVIEFMSRFAMMGGRMGNSAYSMRNLFASAVADAGFDPEQGNFATMLKSAGIANDFIEYLDSQVAEDSDAQARIESRIKTAATEGGLVGPAIDLVLLAGKGLIKAAKTVRMDPRSVPAMISDLIAQGDSGIGPIKQRGKNVAKSNKGLKK